MYSESTHVAIVTNINTNACIPKLYTPKQAAGSNAMITYNIILLVVSFERTCGDDETFNKSLTFAHLTIFIFYDD